MSVGDLVRTRGDSWHTVSEIALVARAGGDHPLTVRADVFAMDVILTVRQLSYLHDNLGFT